MPPQKSGTGKAIRSPIKTRAGAKETSAQPSSTVETAKKPQEDPESKRLKKEPKPKTTPKPKVPAKPKPPRKTSGTKKKGGGDTTGPDDTGISGCGHSAEFFVTPPKISQILRDYPDITVDRKIDRTKSRCKLCDLVITSAKVDAIDYPPPTYESPFKKLEDMNKAKWEAKLPDIKRRLAKAIHESEEQKLEVWKELWAIWGARDDGPEPPEVFVVESESEEDFEIEIPDE